MTNSTVACHKEKCKDGVKLYTMYMYVLLCSFYVAFSKELLWGRSFGIAQKHI